MKNHFITGMAITTAGLMFLLAGCGNQAGLTNANPTPKTAVSAQTQQTTPKAAPQTQDQNQSQATAKTAVEATATDAQSNNGNAEKPDNVYVTVEPGGKLGSDGKMHDAYINGDITLTQGVPVTLHFYNYDEMPHSYTAPKLGLNIVLNKSEKDGVPGVTSYTFTPKTTGTFDWYCALPCDDDNGQWAMSQKGFMRGTVKVVPQKDAVQHVSLVVNAGYKLGPDGKMHDAYTPGDITVNAGQPVELTVYNFDDGAHTFTSQPLGVNLTVTGSKKKGVPSVSTATFTPNKAGVFQWNCMKPCDGENGDWSMIHDGYMMGKVTVK